MLLPIFKTLALSSSILMVNIKTIRNKIEFTVKQLVIR